jgi:hypothetical protein
MLLQNGQLMKSQLLKRNTKCQLYKTIILPTVLNGSASWTLSKAHRALLGGSERDFKKNVWSNTN